MSFSQLLAILKARWMVVTGIVALAFGAALVLSLVLPKRYTSSASVVIDVKSPDPVVGMVLPGMMTPSYLATQVDLLESERVALRVIKALKLGENAGLREDWQRETEGRGSFESWVAELLGKNLKIEPSRESNVITVSYTAPSPQFATAMANAYVEAYIGATADLRTEPARQYGNLYESLAAQLRERLEKAQNRLADYQKSTGLMATDERLDVETARLNELSSQVVQLQALAADANARSAQSVAGADRTTEVLSNPLLANLKAEMARLEAKRGELAERYGDAHPLMMEMTASVNQVRQRIAQETGRINGSSQLNQGVMQSRLRATQTELDKQREKLLRLREQRNGASVMVRDVENLQRAYDQLQARLSQSTLESQATQTNLSVLKHASEPLKHASPRLIVNLAVALFMGTVVGVLTALTIELMDRRVRTNADIVDVLELPILGVMLKTDNLQSSRWLKRRNPLWSIGHAAPRSLPAL